MKQTRICIRALAFTTLILLLLGQNTTYSQEIPPGSIAIEVMITKDMLDKGYYYKISYVTNGDIPIWIIFSNTEKQQEDILLKEVREVSYNQFSIMGSWKDLRLDGAYRLVIMSPEMPDLLKERIQSVRISSNTKQNLEDNNTLIVNGSVGVAPQRGTEKFTIGYQLNETSDIIHKINQYVDDNTIWDQELSKVQKGPREFEWRTQNGQAGQWYRAAVEAKLVSDKSIWDHDISNYFQILQ